MSLVTIPANVHWAKIPKLSLLRSGLTLRSKYTGKRQHINFPFAMWGMQGTLVPKQGTDAAAWRSFVVQLEGQKNTFHLPIPGYEGLQTGVTSEAITLRQNAAARAKSINVMGFDGNTDIFTDGDWITVNGECKMVVGNHSSNGAGWVTGLTIEPGLRTAILAGTAVEINNPYIVMASIDDDSATWELDHPVEHTFKLNLVEAIE